MDNRKTKAAQREETIHKLLEVSRPIFTRDGYAGASTEEIVAQAGVTRGALYHHFGSKEGLFRAVLESIQREVRERVERATDGTDDLWKKLVFGCRAFLSASLDPQVQRIMLVDAPAVLGWDVWRAIDAQHSMKSLREFLEQLTDRGIIAPQPLEALTHLLSGAMNEAALWIARSEQPEQALEEAARTLEHLLQSLRQAGK